VVVIDKAAGLVVHPGSGNRAGTLLNALLHHAPALRELPRAGIVHRLDKDTSGLMVVAKNEAAQLSLVRQLQARTVKRTYLAVARGVRAAAGKVDAPIGRHPVQRTRMAVVASGKPAVTHYRVKRRFARHTLLECDLETGRTHQIRVHLASIGHPLEGDPVYAGRGASLLPRQALHAWKPRLRAPEHRQGRALRIEAAGRLRGAPRLPGKMNPHPDWLVPDWPAPLRSAAFVTTRVGGVSTDEHGSMNLGLSSGDAPENVARNRAIVRRVLPGDPVWLAQVHGIDVADLDATPGPERPRADAAATSTPGRVAVVLTADCMPLLLCDKAAAAWRSRMPAGAECPPA
jgi:hypothetical protein